MESGKGRVQIWLAKPLPRMPPSENLLAQSPTAGLPRQGTSLSSFSLAETVAATAKGSLVYGKAGPAVLFSKPGVPVIVLYTIIKDIWTFLSFECRFALAAFQDIFVNVGLVDKNVYINTKSCLCKECKGPQKLCSRIIIESKGKLKIKRHSADANDSVNTWDLALLRKPTHPMANKTVTTFTAKYLTFTFPSPQGKPSFCCPRRHVLKIQPIDKNDFQTRFGEAQTLRGLDEQEYKKAISEGGRKVWLSEYGRTPYASKKQDKQWVLVKTFQPLSW